MSAVEIKICGITRVEDALSAIHAGAAMLGLNFFPGSPRCIPLEQAQRIAAAVSGRVKLVGVFVNMNVEDVLAIARAVPLDAIQLHGDESPAEARKLAAEFELIRALKVDVHFTPALAAEFAFCRGLLVDTPSAGHGGSGEIFNWASVDWMALRRASSAKLFLAGGLHAANVTQAITAVRPDIVDVCSGVESAKGIKNPEKIREFVAAVRAAERQEP